MTGNIVITYDEWHPCAFYEGGGFWTTRLFWDCECEEDYIHPKSLIGCPKCRAFEEDGQPDSRTYEVLEAGLAVDVDISGSDALRTVIELAEQNALDPEDEDGPLLDQAFIQQRSLDMVRKEFEIASGFTLINGEFEITGYGTIGEFLDYKEYKFLITDGLGQLGEVTISLGLSGAVLVNADQIILDEEGEEQSRKGISKFLFEAERKK